MFFCTSEFLVDWGCCPLCPIVWLCWLESNLGFLFLLLASGVNTVLGGFPYAPLAAYAINISKIHTQIEFWIILHSSDSSLINVIRTGYPVLQRFSCVMMEFIHWRWSSHHSLSHFQVLQSFDKRFHSHFVWEHSIWLQQSFLMGQCSFVLFIHVFFWHSWLFCCYSLHHPLVIMVNSFCFSFLLKIVQRLWTNKLLKSILRSSDRKLTSDDSTYIFALLYIDKFL